MDLKVKMDTLHYTERTDGRFRDLRQIELNFGKKRFARISINGQYRSGKTQYKVTRYANPGWSLGFENLLINWTHFRQHCWHLSFEAFRRGITFSYGRR